MTTNNTLLTCTTALVASAVTIGRAERKSATSVASWAACAAEQLIAGTADLDAINSAIVESVKARHARGPLSRIERISQLARTDYSRAYHWANDMRLVHEAGLTRFLLATETGNDGKPYSLQLLRRNGDPTDAKADDAKASGKGRKAKGAKSEPVTASTTPPASTDAETLSLESIADALTGMAERMSFDVLDGQEAQVSRIVQAAGRMARMIEQGREAARKAKAAKAAAKPRKSRAKAAVAA